MKPAIAAFVLLATSFAYAADQTGQAPDRASSYYHYGLARMYENEAAATGRQDLATQAIEQYKLALNADPDSRVLEDGLANLYFRLGRIREAVDAAKEQTKKHPEDVDAHLLLGRVYLRSIGDGQSPQATEMLGAAIREYETIIRLKPNDIEAHLLTGQLYGLNHESLKAEQQFKEALRVDPGSEEAALNLARLYTEEGDLKKATAALEALPEKDRSARTDLALGSIYDQLKEPAKAAAAYRAALDDDPDNADARRGLAQALTELGKLDEANKVYSKILDGNPQDPQAMIRKADIERQNGRYEEALTLLKQAEQLAPDSLELKYNEALTYDALARFDDAMRTLKDVLAATSNPQGHYNEGEKQARSLLLDRMGIVAREAGLTEESVAAYRKMYALGGDFSVRAAEGIVDTYRDAHLWQKALEEAANAAKEMPENHEVQLVYASQLADNGQLEAGLKLANAQKTGGNGDREVLVRVADIDSRARRWDDAFAAIAKLETASKDGEVAFAEYLRGSIAQQHKQYAEAEVAYRKGLALDKENIGILNNFGYMLADRNMKLDEALDLVQRAVRQDPQNGTYLDSLAWVFYRQGKYALAEETERRAVLRERNDSSIYGHLGDILSRTGKLREAADAWQRSLALARTSLPADVDADEVAQTEKKLEKARVELAHAAAK